MPLRLAVACIASACQRKSETEGRHLFLAGMSLWSTILEVDNREARSPEMLLAVCTRSPRRTARLTFHEGALLIVYGTMTATEAVWKRTTVLSSSSMTVRLNLLQISFLLIEADCATNEIA